MIQRVAHFSGSKIDKSILDRIFSAKIAEIRDVSGLKVKTLRLCIMSPKGDTLYVFSEIRTQSEFRKFIFSKFHFEKTWSVKALRALKFQQAGNSDCNGSSSLRNAPLGALIDLGSQVPADSGLWCHKWEMGFAMYLDGTGATLQHH